MQIRASTLPVQLIEDLVPMIIRVTIVEVTVNGCCDFIAQCTLVRINHCVICFMIHLNLQKIYRCWIVWGKNIWIVTLPLLLAITYIGQ